MSEQEQTPQERRALFRVVHGEPTDAELAALAVVFATVAGGSRGAPGPGHSGPRSAWNDPAARLRRPLHPGPGVWRFSVVPR